jgi:predicted hydrocarbon binding protein
MITDQQVEKLLQGNYTFEHLSFSMLLMRMKMLYTKDSSTTTLQNCTREIGTFLEKFKGTMNADNLILQKL